MEFIGVREFRGHAAAIWKKLSKEKEFIITSNGKPVAVLSAVNGTDVEESLRILRQARAAAAVKAMQKKSVEQGLHGMGLQEINKLIKETRKTHHARQ